MTDTAKILQLCEYNKVPPSADWASPEWNDAYGRGFYLGERAENDKLTPIIRALLADRERLRSALKYELAQVPGPSPMRTDIEEALTTSDAAIAELLKETT